MTAMGMPLFRSALLSLAIVCLLAALAIWFFASVGGQVGHVVAWSKFREVDIRGAVDYEIVRQAWPSVRTWTDFVDEINEAPLQGLEEMRGLAGLGGLVLAGVGAVLLGLFCCAPRGLPTARPNQNS